jgi:membrane-associated phospholipid phosphatase
MNTTAQRTARSARNSTGWAAFDTLRDLWRRFWESARALPTGAWAAWARTLFIGLALTCLVALGLTLWARAAEPQWLAAWDRATLESILARELLPFPSAIVWESPGNGVGVGLLIAAVVLLGVYSRRPLVVASILAAYLLGGAVFWVGWGLWERARPDLVLGGAAAPGLHSFPSGHMVHVTVLYGYLTYLWCRAAGVIERVLAVALCVAWVALVAVSRLVLGTHWPSDLLAGALLGLLWTAALALAHHSAERHATAHNNP